VTEQLDKRADTTRQHILRAASRQFARKSYSLVSLDDILADAEVTKGAMYFHFRSKHALAVAIIDLHVASSRTAIGELLANKLSGMETLIDVSYLFVVRDLTDTVARASLYLLEALGRTNNLHTRIDEWIDGFAVWARQAVDDGDLLTTLDPHDVARLLIAVNSGLHQVIDLDDTEGYLHAFEKAWLQLLPGMVEPGRIAYFGSFIRRRTQLAIRKTRHP
jgi:AcrR family transcriptional regulator